MGIKIPKTARDVIPLKKIYSDGICCSAGNNYSKVYRFTDINYTDLSEEGQEHIFREYMKILAGIDSTARKKITISNHRRDMEKFRAETLYDSDDVIAQEINELIESRIEASSCTEQDRYITVSVTKKSITEARAYFERVSSALSGAFSAIGSEIDGLNAAERLKVYHMFFRPDETESYNFDFDDEVKKGHDFRDYIVPGYFKFRGLVNHFEYGGRYGRVLYLKSYSNYIKDRLFCELLDMPVDMMVSIDYEKIPKDKAVAEAAESMSRVEHNISKWQKVQNRNKNYAAEVPYEMELQRKDTKEFYDDLTERDMDMFCAVITIVHTADSIDQLNADSEKVITKARESSCTIEPLFFQQMEGLQTVIPFGGPPKVGGDGRTLTTEALAVFIPFRTMELNDPGGIVYGTNKISGNIIRINRKTSKNGNKFVLGMSGAGKSVHEKYVFINETISDSSACHVIIDPDGEYADCVRNQGGTVYELSDSSPYHVNAMDVWKESTADWITDKSNFAMGLVKEVVGEDRMDAGYLSIVSRCCKIMYSEYYDRKKTYPETPKPTLKELRKVISAQPEPEAFKISLALELFTEGTLNTFAEQTNIDLNKNIICFDIHEMSKNLKPIAMLVIMDYITGLVSANREKGVETYIDIDEIYQMFLQEQTAEFFYMLWKRIRKMGGFCTGLTQDAEDILKSYTGRTMIENSEMVVMLSLQHKNRMQLKDLLGLSDAQLKYITNAKAGAGLIKTGKYIVPFQNNIPKDTKLYKIINTDFRKREE